MGVLYFQDIKEAIRTQTKYTPKVLNRLAYNASIATSIGLGYDINSNITIGSIPATEFLYNSFEFCNYSCNAIVFFDVNFETQAINPYYYQLLNASCADTITTDSWLAFSVILLVCLFVCLFVCKIKIWMKQLLWKQLLINWIFDRSTLAVTPPVTLTENYFECTNNWHTSLLGAVGISFGNTSSLVPLVALLLLPLIYFYLKSIGFVPPIEEYTKDEVS